MLTIFRDASRSGSRALSASALRAALAVAASDDAQSKKTKTKLRKSRKDSIMGRRDVACRRRKQSDLCRRIVNKDVGRVHFNVSAWRAVGARVRAAMGGEDDENKTRWRRRLAEGEARSPQLPTCARVVLPGLPSS